MVDFGVYVYDFMEVANAARMGAQAAWKACDPSQQPATTQCPGLSAAVNAAIISTSLGGRVALATGSPTEGYYCIDASNTLQYVSSVASKPANCSATGMASVSPGDYLTVQVTYNYAPRFPLSLASVLATPIATTSMIRID